MHFNGPARLYIAAVVLTASLGFPGTVPYASAEPQAASAVLSAIRIDNFGQVDPKYYRGAQPAAHDYADLAALGVKAIINLTSDDAPADEQTMAGKAGLTYFQIPMTTHIAPTSAQLTQLVPAIFRSDFLLPSVPHRCAEREQRRALRSRTRKPYEVKRGVWSIPPRGL